MSENHTGAISVPAFDPFDYHPPSTDQLTQIHQHRTAAKVFRAILGKLPDSREKELAMLRLEEALMWANKAAVRP